MNPISLKKKKKPKTKCLEKYVHTTQKKKRLDSLHVNHQSKSSESSAPKHSLRPWPWQLHPLPWAVLSTL